MEEIKTINLKKPIKERGKNWFKENWPFKVFVLSLLVSMISATLSGFFPDNKIFWYFFLFVFFGTTLFFYIYGFLYCIRHRKGLFEVFMWLISFKWLKPLLSAIAVIIGLILLFLIGFGVIKILSGIGITGLLIVIILILLFKRIGNQ